MRVFGLDGIPSRFSGPFVAESPVDAAYNFQMELRRKLAALGFYETQTIKLIASESADGTIAQVKDALPLRPFRTVTSSAYPCRSARITPCCAPPIRPA